MALLLRSGDAFYSYTNAFLRLPEAESDPDNTRLLHEQSHLLTFAGTDFYADMACRHLTEQELVFGNIPSTLDPATLDKEIIRRNRDFARFLEAVPETLKLLNEPYESGTLPDGRISEQLVCCVTRYKELFYGMWRAVVLQTKYGGFPPKGDWQAVEGPSNLEIVMAIIHTLLDWIFIRRQGELPSQMLSAFQDRLNYLDSGKGLLIPMPGISLREHVRQLFDYGERRIVEMFMDHLQLEHALANATPEQLHRYATLIPNLVGLEFLVELGPRGIKASLFSEGTADHDDRLEAYFSRRLRDGARKDQLAMDTKTLILSLLPNVDGIPVRIRKEHRNDRVARGILQVIALRSFFRELPCFLSRMLGETRFFDRNSHTIAILRWLRETSGEAVDTYICGAAKELNISELELLIGPHKMTKVDEPHIGETWLLSP